MIGPLVLMLMWRSEVSHELTLDWFNWDTKWLWIRTALRDRWILVDGGMVAIISFRHVHRDP